MGRLSNGPYLAESMFRRPGIPAVLDHESLSCENEEKTLYEIFILPRLSGKQTEIYPFLPCHSMYVHVQGMNLYAISIAFLNTM